MTLHSFLEQLAQNPAQIAFSDTMAIIDQHYKYTPTAFTNGEVRNEAGQNAGSCKILAFGQLHHLTVDQTLHCFGTYYRNDVLKNPEGTDHGNIRNFMKTGWEGIQFDKFPLSM